MSDTTDKGWRETPAGPLAFEASNPVLCVRVERAIRMLGIGKTKLYELIAEGELEAIRIGRRTLIMQSSIDDFILRLRLKNSAPRQSA